MKLLNGMDKEIVFNAKTIKAEASQDDGLTSFVRAVCNNKTEISLSQHNSGDWDISVNGEPDSVFDEDQADEAAKYFIALVRENN